MKNQNPIFRGIATALVTPTTPEGIDYDRFGTLIDWQIAQGINALVICGTTGESSTLTDAEHRRAIAYACERVNGRVPVIAGTGSNETDYAVELTKSACADGADAVLVVTPYYNKTTQRGLVTMYNTIADASTKPVILYNVPSRTGIGIQPETYVKLAEHPNIAAIKEANSDISKIVETFYLVGDKLDIYSGNDDQIVPILSMGGMGCISVLSNVVPAGTVAITDKFFAGDVAGAAQLQCKYMPLIRSLFCESNPIPVKAAMAAMGYCENFLRLPLVPMEEDHYETMIQRMRALGINVLFREAKRGDSYEYHRKWRGRAHGPAGLPPGRGRGPYAGRCRGPQWRRGLCVQSGRVHRSGGCRDRLFQPRQRGRTGGLLREPGVAPGGGDHWLHAGGICDARSGCAESRHLPVL